MRWGPPGPKGAQKLTFGVASQARLSARARVRRLQEGTGEGDDLRRIQRILDVFHNFAWVHGAHVIS